MPNVQHYYITSYTNCNDFLDSNMYASRYTQKKDKFTIITIIVNLIFRSTFNLHLKECEFRFNF